MSSNGNRKKRRLYSLGITLCVIAVAVGGFFLKAQRRNGKVPSVPAVEVKLGDFVDYVEMRGEIQVRSSTVISAPYNTGELQILKLIPNGSRIKKGDAIVQFDPSTLQRSADQARSTLKQVEAEIARAKAQQLLSDEQFLTETMSAQFSLERARLDASTRDVISAIENEKNRLALDKAEHKLEELETKKASRLVGTEADLAGIIRKQKKAQADLEQAERNMGALTLMSPMEGLITLLPNSRARTSVLSSGTTPIFKEGDRAYAGAAIAEIPDLSTIQANAPVTEVDRGRVQLGQPVVLSIEGVPDKEHRGKVSEISPLAKLDYSGYPVTKNFDLTVRLENPDPRLRPGMTSGFRVEVERVPGSIVIPASAIFEKGGQTVAYVLSNGVYQERRIVVARRGIGQVMISNGLKPGERIALKDPSIERQE
jgi:HlyD family secretion protein